MPSTLDPVLLRAMACWRRGDRAEGLSAILEWILNASAAERALVFSVGSEGAYRILGSRNTDGEAIREAERSISLFAVRKARDAGEGSFFADTRLDRRFRTEAERTLGVKTRSIWVIPLETGTEGLGDIYLYLDSRFRPIERPTESGEFELAIEALGFWSRFDRQERENRTLERRVRRLRQSRHAESGATSRPVVRLPEEASREVDFHGFVTRCPELIAEIGELRNLAKMLLPILIEGETGTGKEVLARAIHAESERTGKFVSLHCGSLPASLVEVELFGHARGAFTGAEAARTGLFELARGGTLFLDDIGQMSTELQNALLRVLETNRYRPLSDPEERVADVRVIASRRLGADEAGEATKLREDLYFRLAGAKVVIPPLRERGEDIPLLTELFLARYSNEADGDMPEDFAAALLTYHWPGNTRELENIVRRLVALGSREFDAERFAEVTGLDQVGTVEGPRAHDIRSVVDRAEREAIIRALQKHGGNKSHAAKALGLSRKTLYRRMEKHGIPL